MHARMYRSTFCDRVGQWFIPTGGHGPSNVRWTARVHMSTSWWLVYRHRRESVGCRCLSQSGRSADGVTIAETGEVGCGWQER